jgi:hypothetical protein
MTEEFDERPAPVRQQTWPTDSPAELEVTVEVGRVRVLLEEGLDEVRVEVRHDPTAGGGWEQGLTGLINWLGAGPSADERDLAADAVRDAEISWSEAARRLVVRSSTELPLRVVPLAVTVTAPVRSRLAVRTGSGDVDVTGRAGWAAVRTGSGEVAVAAVDGDADMSTGSGGVDVGPVTGRARVRTGSGRVALAEAGGPTEVKTGSGAVRVGAVRSDLGVRTGSGGITLDDVEQGRVELTSGSGDLRIGVHPGVTAEVDLSSGSGRARSELEVGAVAPAQPAVLHVRGRTGSGDVLVVRAGRP